MIINPDKIEIFKIGPLHINATIFFTWVVMAFIVLSAYLITRKLSKGPKVPSWQLMLETLVTFVNRQVEEVVGQDPSDFVPFLGSLGLFILLSNVFEVIPFYHAPTSSLSTTTALAVSVFIAVPFFGIYKKGILSYLKGYIEPSFLMLPFHIISEFSRTISLAVRLFGNMMSEALLGGILLLIVPLFVPILMQIFSLLIGIVQAYIFFVLATVYIGGAAAAHNPDQIIERNNKEDQ